MNDQLHPSTLLNQLHSLERRQSSTDYIPQFIEEPEPIAILTSPATISIKPFEKRCLDLDSITPEKKTYRGFKKASKPQKYFIIYLGGGLRRQKFYDDYEVQISADCMEILMIPRFAEDGLIYKICGRNLSAAFGELVEGNVAEIGCPTQVGCVIDSITFLASATT